MDGRCGSSATPRVRPPLLGTCAGFQHLVIELARDVLGIADAAHAENDPDAPNLFVTPLACSLVGQSMTVLRLDAGGRPYPAASATERYYRRFGLHPDRVADLEAAGVVVSGVDQDGEPRIMELPAALRAGHAVRPADLERPRRRPPERRRPVAAAHARSAVTS